MTPLLFDNLPLPPRPVRGIICDMDGTLVGSEYVCRAKYQEVAKERGFVLTDDDFAAMIGHPPEVSANILGERLGNHAVVPDLRDEAHRRYRVAMHAGQVPPLSGVREGLAWLTARGIPLAVATSSLTEVAETKLAKVNLRQHFTAVVGRDQVTAPKPAPETFQHAAARLGLRPEDCLAIEDSPTGLRAAVAAGTMAALIPDLVDPTPETVAMANWRFANFGALVAWLQGWSTLPTFATLFAPARQAAQPG